MRRGSIGRLGGEASGPVAIYDNPPDRSPECLAKLKVRQGGGVDCRKRRQWCRNDRRSAERTGRAVRKILRLLTIFNEDRKDLPDAEEFSHRATALRE